MNKSELKDIFSHSSSIFILYQINKQTLHISPVCLTVSSYCYRFTCWPEELLSPYVDLPDTTCLLNPEHAAEAVLSGSGPRLHQLQHR